MLGIGDTSTITSTKTTKDGEQTTEEFPQTLMTLAVTAKDAQKVFYAVANGELVRRPADDEDRQAAEDRTHDRAEPLPVRLAHARHRRP